MERKKGTFILNDTRTRWQGRAQAIHVLSETTFNTISDNKNKNQDYYISISNAGVPAGAYIVARDGALFSNISLTSGAIEIIF
jgi:hypothetical protein